MGRNKQAQRTKNNARPSNSSRSAELLGTAMPKFVGFSAVNDGGYVPVLPGLSLSSKNEVEMNNVDSNFQIVLKKMNKKDATTKCKALLEFAVLCKDSELSAVEGMLPFWPRLYCVLAIDVEHRVREGAQLAHAAVVKRVGKGIAMYLKQLAGAWFTSQHDTYAPAASAATNSFSNTFPQKKIVDAIVHCQHEILQYICDNITIQTAQSLCLRKNLAVEEMEAKYQRVLIASLQGYSSYLRKVPTEEIEKMSDIHYKIVRNSKFWKLVKYDALPVKTAFFNVLTSLIDNASILLQDEKKRAVTTIMNSLDETEPALVSAVWESMLVAITKIEDWYSFVSIEKLVLPKLWRVLRAGGQYSASIVYPNLLPFVSQFPKFNIDVRNLYTNFFENMRQGFSVKSVQTSRSEMFAVTTSFIECLRYSVLLNAKNRDLSATLLKEQLIPVIGTCLKENSPMKQILFCEIAQLVRYWSKNRGNEELRSYAYLMEQFWSELNRLVDLLIDVSQNSGTFDIPDTNNSQIEFLITLKTAPTHSRKNLKVKFPDPEDDIKLEVRAVATTEVDTDAEFLKELNNFVISLCVKYFDKITEQRTRKYVTYLNKLITCFESEKLFASLAESKTQINFLSFYDQVLRVWLLEQSIESVHIVELIFNFITYMNDSEKDEVLRSLTKFEDIATTRSVIHCALSKRHRNDAIIRKWCSQSKTTDLLVDVVKEIATGNYSDLEKSRDLILLAFETPDDDSSLVEESRVNEVVSILCDSIHNVDETCLLRFAQLISSIVPLIWTHKEATLGAVRVLETLFELCSQDYFANDSTCFDAMRAVWKNGVLEAVRKLSEEKFIELTRKFATILWKKIYSSNEEQTNEILLDIASDFLEIVIEINDQLLVNKSYIEKIILTFFYDSDTQTWMAETSQIVLYGEVITGRFRHGLFVIQDMLTSDTVTDNTEECLKWACFNANFWKNICLTKQKALMQCIDLPGITDLLTDVIYSILLGQIYTKYYKSTKCYSNVNKMLSTVEDSFEQLKVYTNEDTGEEIRNYIETNSEKYGSMSSYLINFCRVQFSGKTSAKTYSEESVKAFEVDEILDKLQTSGDTSTEIDDDIREVMRATYKVRNLSGAQNPEDKSSYSSILEKIMSYEKDNPNLLLFNRDISSISLESSVLPFQVILLLTELVTNVPSLLTDEQWNFILISLATWQLHIVKSKQLINDTKVDALTVYTCQLYHALQNVINKQDQIPPTILDEWNNVLAGDIQSSIAKIWMSYADCHNERPTDLRRVVVLDRIGRTVKMLNGDVLLKNQANTSPIVAVNLTQTVDLCLKLLQSPVPSIQLGAYHLLKHTVSKLVQEDKLTVELENFSVESLNIKNMENTLQNTQNIVNTVLMDFKLCDTVSCTIQPYTDSYTYTVGYLLLWSIILDMCANAHGDLLYHYAETLKDNFFPSLLNNIFRLMPVEVLQDNKNKGAKLTEIFSTEPSLEFGESWTEWRLDHIVCWLYRSSLRHLPVLVRQWWSAADSRVSAAVDKITTHYVSPMLCQELLSNKPQNIENMQVKVHSMFREVTALYEMSDTKLELNITLPPNHPLGTVIVEPGQHAGGTANWRNCHMQLAIFLTHQNGSVWDGLALWKKNLDKKFAGVEECYICFSIFHSSSYQIPKVSCHSCRKKFHTACLYKWFSTSQKATCPICRDVF
ncbi:E3 ubiquitin-protein ligase listerin [Lasioglossum baleicum]|uniref:E3 ubiquitin-protein ligase listerin n=1 Tax=Lasioglossum baleicum TaxID=434251 RepID=UPI003FCD0B9D